MMFGQCETSTLIYWIFPRILIISYQGKSALLHLLIMRGSNLRDKLSGMEK